MAVYTRRGDDGKTNLYFVKRKDHRLSKNERVFWILGGIDELNSVIGIAREYSRQKKNKEILKKVQEDLFLISSIIGGYEASFQHERVKYLEKIIDGFEKKLPVVKNFIFPGGSKSSAFLHFARSKAREVERILTPYFLKGKVNSSIFSYMNRLSDLLFVLARVENFAQKGKDVVWQMRRK